MINKITEQQNPNSQDIDKKNILGILHVINNEDQKVANSVRLSIPFIETFVTNVIDSFKNHGRLIYIGSGTSGRLGILDASECPPTYSVTPDLVQGIIAGGKDAVFRSIENAEDNERTAIDEIKSMNINPNDSVLGITASSKAAFVMAALKEAKKAGAFIGLLVCNNIEKPKFVDILIEAPVGPEIITGSTRMKAGTATKLILNMITTTAMIKMNKTYGNLMVDLRAWNQKLWDRGTGIISLLCGLSQAESLNLLVKCDGEVKTAVVINKLNISVESARQLLAENEGSLRKVIDPAQ